MPASTVKSAQNTISSLVKTATQHLFKQFPHHEPRLRALLDKRFEIPTSPKNNTVQEKFVFKPALPQDEVISIVEKTHQLSLLPGLSFDKETELYLEQQLEDVFGFSLSSSLNSINLPFTKGTLESLPHLYTSPSMTIKEIERVPEAGLSTQRPFFGWQIALSPDAEQQTAITDYWISFPLRQWLLESRSLAMIKQWAYKRKLILVNPTDALFAVVEILDEYLPLSGKFQLGASPAVIREGLFWSPQNSGKVMVFFLSESGTNPSPGVYSLF